MEDYLVVAKIVKPQGIRGEVKVLCETDSPDDLCAFERVYIGGNAYKMLKVRPQPGDCAFITLSGIADRNAAELLRDMQVCVKKEDAPALPEGTYYIADLLGFEVSDDNKKVLGRLSDIIPAKTDIYEIEKPSGGIISFPCVEGVIESVDKEQKRIVLNRKKLAEVSVESK